MTNDQRRKRHVKHILAPISLSGYRSSAKLIEQYLNEALSAGELAALTKGRHRPQDSK